MTARSVAIALLLTLTTFAAAYAEDAYVVRFFAFGRGTECAQSLWLDNILFFNRTSAPAVVKLLGVSNGPVPPDVLRELSLPPNRAVAIRNGHPFSGSYPWQPQASAPLWVVHLDIPEGVTIESRDEVYAVPLCGLTDGRDGLPEDESAGKVSLPIFRSLVPAGVRQIKLGTDLSSHGSRLNVAIYNAATEEAHATIEIRRVCDDALLDTRSVVIAADAITQFGGFSGSGGRCLGSGVEALYTAITVDRPGFSYVSNVSESLPSLGLGIVPPIGLAVSNSTDY